MILLFPDLDTLRLCLTSSIVSQEVTLAPAVATFDEQNRIYVEPSIGLSKTTMKNLDRLGVKGSKRHATEDVQQVSSWLELVPAVKEAAPPALSSQATVLFELESGDDFPVLVAELLRLGNDRQSFRWFARADEPDARRVLLRVIGPPYYTLLRALDHATSGSAGRIRAYIERSPRVWVELGVEHPFAAQVRVSESQLVLIRESRAWQFLNDAPFQDIYDILQFQLPSKPVGWTESESVPKLVVPMRLAAGNAADVAEMWVLRGDGVRQLDTLVRDADERLIQRLTFAVATDPQGRETAVLRTRPSKLPPPALPLEHATAFKPFSKLPNLFVPVGRRLHPTLRREAVRRLMADDADQVVWLFPDEKNGFVPECIPDAAFRPLEGWVEYIIEAGRLPLAAWIEATRFDFDQFIGREDGGPKPKPDGGNKPPQANELDRSPTTKAFTPQAKPGSKGKSTARAPIPAEFAAPHESPIPNEWKRRREELEKQFLAAEGTIDAEPRKALWPELAVANMKMGEPVEAAICWLNAFWDRDSIDAKWLSEWVQCESHPVPHSGSGAAVHKILHATVTTSAEVRFAIASFIGMSYQIPVSDWIRHNANDVQNFLTRNEGVLPIRMIWWAHSRISVLTNEDVLGLARVRDRLLNRLLDEGLSAEKDLPGFLRFTGARDADRLRAIREKAVALREVVLKWCSDSATAQKNELINTTLPYINLLFSYALAKLGDSSIAIELLDHARSALIKSPPANWTDPTNWDAVVDAVASTYLMNAYQYRIDNARQGKSNTGPLSPELQEELREIAKKGELPFSTGSNTRHQIQNPFGRAEYVINRLRHESKLLEPQEKPELYLGSKDANDLLKREAIGFSSIRDPQQLADRIRKRLRDGFPGRTQQELYFIVLTFSLPIAARAGEALSVELLSALPKALPLSGSIPQYPDTPKLQGKLIERSLLLAAHFGRSDLVLFLVDHFVSLVQAVAEKDRFPLINAVRGQLLQTLQKFGMRDQLDRLLSSLSNELLRGKSIDEMQHKYMKQPDEWCVFLQSMLNIAAGWLIIGTYDRALPLLDSARFVLIDSKKSSCSSREFTELARAYVRAVGHLPHETALLRITQLFQQMSPERITSTWTTKNYYSRFHLTLVEDVILALVSDEFALGPAGRKWLDDDEYLVRRRIHDDMKRHIERSGL